MNIEESKQWFKNAKFGMMIHFGLYSLLGGEYKGKRISNIGEWIMHTFKIPISEYSRLAEVFNPIYFDAEEWVKTAKSAGMEYMVITAKHHEGFALFKSSASGFNSVDGTPFKRDIIAELAEACAKHNMKLGIYYSQSLDWHEFNGAGYTEKAEHENNSGVERFWANGWDFPENDKKDYNICFENKIKPQVKELLTNYGDICLIWFDTPMREQTYEHSKELYDMVRKYQPGCLVNSRIGNGVGDYHSCDDNTLPEEYTDALVESPITLNRTWGYKSYDNDWKSPSEVRRILEKCNSKGANLLLNVGPDGLGRFPVPATKILNNIKKQTVLYAEV